MFKTLSTAAAIALMASASFAGSLNTNIEVVENDAPAFVPQGSGISTPAIIGGVAAAVVIAALVANSDDDDDAAPATTQD